MSDIRLLKIKRRTKTKEKCHKFDTVKVNLNITSTNTVGPELIRHILSNEKTLFLSLLAFRVVNALMIQTASVPDEYWQSVEVAHKIVFNIGYLTWEWLSEVAIRSPVYPLMFAVPFKLLQIFNLDYRILIIKIPLIIQATFASIGDFYFYKFCFLHSGQQVAQWALINQLMNWFMFYSLPRTLINNVEWVLVILALYEYEKVLLTQYKVLSRRFLLITSICFILRPTGVVVLIPICVYHIFYSINYCKYPLYSISNSFFNGFLVGAFSLSLSLLCDKHFYGQWTCSQWNFLQFNLLTDVAQNYGVHKWHWYWSQGLPAMLTTQLVPLVASLVYFNDSIHLWALIITVIQIYSYVGHKEFRFITSIMPLLMLLIGKFTHKLSQHKSIAWSYWLCVITLATQLPMMLYMNLIHQRGTVDVVMGLGRLVERTPQYLMNQNSLNVVFLMPCHSTPWSSHLHYNISSRFLTCDPQILGSIKLESAESKQQHPSLKSYDEADVFYNNPQVWLINEYGKGNHNNIRPTFWILFDKLLPQLTELLIYQWNYTICHRYFHSHFPTHSHQSQRIVVLCAPTASHVSL